MSICLHAQVLDVGIVFTAFLSQIKPTAAHNKLQISFALLEILRVDAQEYQLFANQYNQTCTDFFIQSTWKLHDTFHFSKEKHLWKYIVKNTVWLP